MPFQIIRNDITKVTADAIVNTANPMPVYSGGTDAAIYQAAGAEELLEARKKIGEIPRGEAVETPAFRLLAKYIIHTVGPRWTDGEHGEYETLHACYRNSLMLAQRLGCRSVAFPLIATGVYGFPKDRALRIALDEIQHFLMDSEMKVILVVFDRKAFELSGKVVDRVRAYVDENYVEQQHIREHRGNRVSWRPERETYSDGGMGEEMTETEDRCDMRWESDQLFFPMEAPKAAGGKVKEGRSALLGGKRKKISLKELIEKPEATFQEKLFQIIDERGLTGPQVYKNYISKQVYSKIQADPNYHPNKFTAIALCLSLHLNLEETQDLIGRAGWTLSPSNKADLVVKGCILNEEFNLVQINILLFDYDCPTLDKIK